MGSKGVTPSASSTDPVLEEAARASTAVWVVPVAAGTIVAWVVTASRVGNRRR